MVYLITGAAGFIGMHVAQALLAEGTRVIGIDNLNDYYDVQLKAARRNQLSQNQNFTFYHADFTDATALAEITAKHQDITHVIHLGAQAGVRYSLKNPASYVHSNVLGSTLLLEAIRQLPKIQHFIFASTSSVYGNRDELPFDVNKAADTPISIYAATKRAAELMSYTYSHLYGLPQTGLRFFTVYGPWGRPDMAAYQFTDKIIKGEPITVYHNGNLQRDFTYIDDIVAGVLAATQKIPIGDVPYQLYNLGNHKPETLMDFITVLAGAIGRNPQIEYAPLPPGDMLATYADITTSQRDLGFQPRTPISEGLPQFVQWYRAYHGV